MKRLRRASFPMNIQFSQVLRQSSCTNYYPTWADWPQKVNLANNIVIENSVFNLLLWKSDDK